MLVERRRGAFPAELIVRVGFAWAIVAALLLAINWQALAQLRFPDPDDAMRLVQVRDLIAGQSWFDLTQYRVDAPGGGVAMHWSRLVDAPLYLVIFLLTPLIGVGAAEASALVIVPLVTLFCAMLLAARIAWRLIGDEETMLTSLLVALSIPLLFQLGPLRIDHHGWQVVCALAAVNALMARNPRNGAIGVGIACAVWLAISVEGLPLAAAIFAVLALRWLRDRSQRVWLTGAIQTLALASAALFLLGRGTGDLAVHCDAIGPLHLAIFAWGALVLTGLSRIEPAPIGLVLAGFALAGGGALALLLIAAPQCASGGGFADIDPLVAQHWLAHVNEGQPVWRQRAQDALPFIVPPLIGLWAASNLARQSGAWLRRFWSDYALILGAALLVALFVARAGAVACALAAPPLAWQVGQWLRASRRMDSAVRRMGAMAALAFALVPTFPLVIAGLAMPAKAALGTEEQVAGSLRQSDCDIAAAGEVLAGLAAGEIYAPLDIAPALLLESRHTVVATPHHRGEDGIAFVIRTALSSSADARAALSARGTAYVALCPGLNEPRNYAHIAADGFAADLLEGRVPGWLDPIGMPQDTALQLWRVTPL